MIISGVDVGDGVHLRRWEVATMNGQPRWDCENRTERPLDWRASRHSFAARSATSRKPGIKRQLPLMRSIATRPNGLL